jgi:hypothetical protein
MAAIIARGAKTGTRCPFAPCLAQSSSQPGLEQGCVARGFANRGSTGGRVPSCPNQRQSPASLRPNRRTRCRGGRSESLMPAATASRISKLALSDRLPRTCSGFGTRRLAKLTIGLRRKRCVVAHAWPPRDARLVARANEASACMMQLLAPKPVFAIGILSGRSAGADHQTIPTIRTFTG